MPLPLYTKEAEVEGNGGVLVHLGGIAHLVAEGVEPTLDFFEKVEPLLRDIPGLDAYGVIFLNDGRMTPLVKVPAAGSLVWEGSCGSGTLAAAVAQSLGTSDGPFIRNYVQPAGTVQAGVVREDGRVTECWIGGPVSLGDPLEVEI